MKWTALILLTFLLIPTAHAPTHNPNYTFTLANNNTVTLGTIISFYLTGNNGTHLRLDQTYSSKHYTSYYLAITTTSDTLTINTWFPTIDSINQAEATLTATTAQTFTVYSANFETTGYLVSGAASWTFSTGTFTITATAGATITIKATVNETAFNGTPENVSVEITSMDVGNYVFSGESYTYRAKYWDSDGYGDLDLMELAFYDGLTWVNATYQDGFELSSGSDVAFLSGSTAVIDSKVLQVDYIIRLDSDILDVDDVELYMRCSDDSNAVDGWDLMRSDYFNIYDLGGQSTITSSGDAGRLPKGDVFDLYANGTAATSEVEVTLTFRNLQHIKMLPEFKILSSSYSALLWTYVDWYLKVYVDDEWNEVLRMRLSPLDESHTTNRHVQLEVNSFDPISADADNIYSYASWTDSNQTTSMRMWLDLWINKQNSSSVVAGRFNAYYFPMSDSSNPWFRWLTGSNWGINEAVAKQYEAFYTMLDGDNNTIYAQQIKMVQIGVYMRATHVDATNTYIDMHNTDVFDLTLGPTPLEGVMTPAFDETKVPIMPQGGFLGYLGSLFNNFFSFFKGFMGFVDLLRWAIFVMFLDTIAGWAGYPGLFTSLFSFIGNLWNGVVTGFTVFASLLGSFLTFSGSFLTDLVATIASGASSWSSMVTMIYDIVGGAYGVGLDLGNLIVQSQALTIAMILYPLYLLYLWDQHGFDALTSHLLFVKDILAFIGGVFLRIIEIFTNIISRIIEAVPVAE